MLMLFVIGLKIVTKMIKMVKYKYWEETHVKCDFCGKWYNPENSNSIYNIANEKEELGLSKDDKREYCCDRCYKKLIRDKKKKDKATIGKGSD